MNTQTPVKSYTCPPERISATFEFLGFCRESLDAPITDAPRPVVSAGTIGPRR
jgi:hypothetical protein